MHDTIKMPALLAATRPPRGKAALRYEKQERVQYRDCLLFYCDGRVLFERYCYGEAAGLVFSRWLTAITPEGECCYQYPLPIEVKEDALPKLIELLPDGRLRVNNNYNLWGVAATLDTDKPNGYGRLRVLLGR